jgi:iron-sulfur cluster repair protein YtfE (RIC family)
MSFYKKIVTFVRNYKKYNDMKISSDTQVGEVVKMNFRTASFFQSHHIDYCCGGYQSIEDACNKAGINTDDTIKQLETVLKQQDSDTLYISSLQLDELSDYIVKNTMLMFEKTFQLFFKISIKYV